MSKPIFVLNGPNLNLLGEREPAIYGSATLQDVRTAAEARAKSAGVTIDFRQTNHEGVMIDWIHEARANASAMVINAGAWTHTSIAILDALKVLTIPIIEVHLSNPVNRESFRSTSFVAPASVGCVAGFGVMSYELGIEAAARLSMQKSSKI